MKVKVFTVPWTDEAGGFDDRELQAFLADRTALEVSEHFFVHEKKPVLVLVISYRGGETPARPGRGAGNARDDAPAADLTPEERERYEALRTWRNQYARKTGCPPYVVFTNRQAADLARKAPTTRAELGEIRGIGASRVEDFGEQLLALLSSLPVKAPEKAQDGSDERKD